VILIVINIKKNWVLEICMQSIQNRKMLITISLVLFVLKLLLILKNAKLVITCIVVIAWILGTPRWLPLINYSWVQKYVQCNAKNLGIPIFIVFQIKNFKTKCLNVQINWMDATIKGKSSQVSSLQSIQWLTNRLLNTFLSVDMLLLYAI
jgi:hypothetical protein